MDRIADALERKGRRAAVHVPRSIPGLTSKRASWKAWKDPWDRALVSRETWIRWVKVAWIWGILHGWQG